MTREEVEVEVPVAPDTVCYEAHWQEQSVFISAPCQSAREWQWHTLASAILLERLEDACVLAESLLESSLQFFVSALPDQESDRGELDSDYLKVVLDRAEDEVEIWLPAQAHRQVLQHEKLLSSSKLRWAQVMGSVQLASIELDAQDMSRLKLGSVVLIPASWQSQWHCSVDVPQFDRCLNAVIKSGDAVIRMC